MHSLRTRYRTGRPHLRAASALVAAAREVHVEGYDAHADAGVPDVEGADAQPPQAPGAPVRRAPQPHSPEDSTATPAPARRPGLASSLLMGVFGYPIAGLVPSLLVYVPLYAQAPYYYVGAGRRLWVMNRIGPGRSTVMILGTGIIAAAIVWLCARHSPGWRERIGFRPPRCTRDQWLLIVLGVAAAEVVGTGLSQVAIAMHWAPHLDSKFLLHLVQLINDAEPLAATMLVLAIGLGPALGEELIFRGFVLRGLLARWRPWAAILVASAMFSAWHVDPSRILGTIASSLWLTWVAWRTGSVLPGMACHALNNCIVGAAVALLPRQAVVSMDATLPLPQGAAVLLAGAALMAWVGPRFAALRPAPPAVETAPRSAAPVTLAAGETAG